MMTNQSLFSPEGRLYQVEYAIEAVARAGACVGILASDGLVLVGEIPHRHPLLNLSLEPKQIYDVNKYNACMVTGDLADGERLVDAMKKMSQHHKNVYGETMPPERLVERICRKKQAHTMYGGLRPFTVSVIYMGWDRHAGYQLFQSDPSGNYAGWRNVCIGRNARQAQSFLNEELCGRAQPDLMKAIGLAIQALEVAMDGDLVRETTIQVATLMRLGHRCELQILDQGAILQLLRIHYHRTAPRE